MSIQHCPDEVLDMIFQLLPFQSPDKAPTTLLHTLLTCRRFCAIAKRHLIRVVCLESAERVNLFAAYLTQLTDPGASGSAAANRTHGSLWELATNPRKVTFGTTKVKLRGQQNPSFHLSFRSQRRASALSLYSGLVPGICLAGSMARMSGTKFASQRFNGLFSSNSISSAFTPREYKVVVIAFLDSRLFILIEDALMTMFSHCTHYANFVSICMKEGWFPIFHPRQISVLKPSS